MRRWNLRRGDPLSLILAADARLAQLDYANDQIWELALGTADPAAVLLHTTYGLRAKRMRLFPRFLEGDVIRVDPRDFDSPPAVHVFYPNYLQLSCSPFPGLSVTAEYWAPSSQIVAGRLRLRNSGVAPRKFLLEWVAQLNPAEGGEPMAANKIEAVTILQGKSGGLTPVVFMTGGPEGVSSPYASLAHKLDLSPGQARQFTWVQAATHDALESFRLARQTAARNWEAELARIELTNSDQLEVETGDPDWDAAFALGQKVARQLIHSPTDSLPHTSFVFTRQPDQGYSARGDGADYNHLWNGQTALEAWHLGNLLLPGAADTAKGLLLNFLASQTADGFVDWKPGLGGQRGRHLATPVLCALAWRIYESTHDKEFLSQSFRKLVDFVNAWFRPEHDRDEDGIPEWDHAVQTGFEDNPLFALWHPWALGADITLYESPALCAFLHSECLVLIKMAEIVGREEAIPGLQAIADNLRNAAEAAWDDETSTYRYWDRETHRGQPGELLGEQTGPGDMFLDLVFELPSRLLLRLQTQDEITVKAHAFIHGTTANGRHRVERVGREQFQWFLGFGSATGKLLYSDLERVEIKGLPPNAKASVYLVDYGSEDHTLLLPLWAHIPDAKRARQLVRNTLTRARRYWRKYGIPACPAPPDHPDAGIVASVWLPWNALIGEGLLRYGYREEAADLVTRLMNGSVLGLKRDAAFAKHIHVNSGQSLGERDALAGLPPLGVFLQTLGVRIISPWKVALDGFNPYPWPVRIKFKGMVIECNAQDTTITFPNGETVTVADPAPCVVEVR